jgi:hypothetical protein
MDTFGTCDAFVKINYLGKSIKTSVVTQKNDEAYWSQEIWLPIQAPLVSGRIAMSVYDRDTTVDDLVGSMSFDVQQIIKDSKGGKPWFWKDIYGAASGVSGSDTDKMNCVPEIASHWKGRILMQVSVRLSDKPEMKIRSVSEKNIQR